MVTELEIDSGRVSVRLEPGASPTLVFLHGAGDNRHAFDRLIDALPGMARMAIDRPGRLGTEGPPLTTVGDAATFTRACLASGVRGPYVLVGHSLGGAIVLELALSMSLPGLIGVVLISTGGRLRVHLSILSLFDQLAAEGAGSRPVSGLFAKGTDPATAAEISENLARTPASTGRADWGAADEFDRLGDLGSVSVPALIVSGSDDRLTPPKYAEHLRDRLPHADLCVIEGAGHMAMVERAPEVAEAIRDFLAALP